MGERGESKLNGISYAHSITYVINIKRFETKRNAAVADTTIAETENDKQSDNNKRMHRIYIFKWIKLFLQSFLNLLGTIENNFFE